MRAWNSIRKIRLKSKFLAFLSFFKIFYVSFRPNRINYLLEEKPLDPIDFKTKEALSLSSAWSNRIMKILRK